MATPLRSRLSDLASTFAASVLDAIRGASLEELLGQSAGRGGRTAVRVDADAAPSTARRRGKRLPRRSADDIVQVIDGIVALLKEHPRGLRAEEIRDKLGLQAKELPRPLKEALDAGRLSKVGQKRATTYFAKGAGGGGASSGRSSAARPGRRAAKAGKGRRRAKPAAAPTKKKAARAGARATKKDGAPAASPMEAQA